MFRKRVKVEDDVEAVETVRVAATDDVSKKKTRRECSVCNEKPVNLKRHWLSQHGGGMCRYEYCGHVSNDDENAAFAHFCSHRVLNEALFKCKLCTAAVVFACESDLWRHEYERHESWRETLSSVQPMSADFRVSRRKNRKSVWGSVRPCPPPSVTVTMDAFHSSFFSPSEGAVSCGDDEDDGEGPGERRTDVGEVPLPFSDVTSY